MANYWKGDGEATVGQRSPFGPDLDTPIPRPDHGMNKSYRMILLIELEKLEKRRNYFDALFYEKALEILIKAPPLDCMSDFEFLKWGLSIDSGPLQRLSDLRDQRREKDPTPPSRFQRLFGDASNE